MVHRMKLKDYYACIRKKYNQAVLLRDNFLPHTRGRWGVEVWDAESSTGGQGAKGLGW